MRKLRSFEEAEAAFLAEELTKEEEAREEEARQLALVEMVREKARAFAVEPSPELRAEENALWDRYTARAMAHGVPVPPKPEVIYFPHEKRNEVFAEMHLMSCTWAYFDPKLNLVLVPVENGLTALETARAMAHELDHATVNVAGTIGLRQGDAGANTLWRTGLIRHSRQGIFGRVAEEGVVALEERRYAEEVLKTRFPNDAAEEDAVITRLIEKGAIPESQRRYATVRRIEASRYAYVQSGYAPIADLVEWVEGEIPGGRELFEASRMTGDLMPLARAFEERFGSGSFRAFFALDFSYADSEGMQKFTAVCAALRAFLEESDPARREALAGTLLAGRPKDLRKVLARIERKETVEV